MRAAAVWTVVCSVVAMACAGMCVMARGWDLFLLSASTPLVASFARGGLQAIEVATRPAGRRL